MTLTEMMTLSSESDGKRTGCQELGTKLSCKFELKQRWSDVPQAFDLFTEDILNLFVFTW